MSIRVRRVRMVYSGRQIVIFNEGLVIRSPKMCLDDFDNLKIKV